MHTKLCTVVYSPRFADSDGRNIIALEEKVSGGPAITTNAAVTRCPFIISLPAWLDEVCLVRKGSRCFSTLNGSFHGPWTLEHSHLMCLGFASYILILVGSFHCPIQYCSVDFHLVGTCLQTTPTSPDNEKHSGVSFSPNKFEDIKVMWLHEWLSFSSRAEYSLSFTTRPDYKCSPRRLPKRRKRDWTRLQTVGSRA